MWYHCAATARFTIYLLDLSDCHRVAKGTPLQFVQGVEFLTVWWMVGRRVSYYLLSGKVCWSHSSCCSNIYLFLIFSCGITPWRFQSVQLISQGMDDCRTFVWFQAGAGVFLLLLCSKRLWAPPSLLFSHAGGIERSFPQVKSKSAQIPGPWSPGRLHFLQFRLTFLS